MKLTEHAQLLAFIKRKEIEKASFIAKLTSNDKEKDINLAKDIGDKLAEKIINDIKIE